MTNFTRAQHHLWQPLPCKLSLDPGLLSMLLWAATIEPKGTPDGTRCGFPK